MNAFWSKVWAAVLPKVGGLVWSRIRRRWGRDAKEEPEAPSPAPPAAEPEPEAPAPEPEAPAEPERDIWMEPYALRQPPMIVGGRWPISTKCFVVMTDGAVSEVVGISYGAAGRLVWHPAGLDGVRRIEFLQDHVVVAAIQDRIFEHRADARRRG